LPIEESGGHPEKTAQKIAFFHDKECTKYMETVEPSNGDIFYARNVSDEELYNLEFIPVDWRMMIKANINKLLPTDDAMPVQFSFTDKPETKDFTIRGLAVKKFIGV